MRVLSLFTGGGLGDYGLELAGMETVGQVEKDDYCQRLLSLRWPDVPKWRDIHDVTGDAVRERCGHIDVVAGGFPCQPFSVAGKQKGKQDNRYLWPQMFRVIREVAPAWVIAENVPGIIKFALDDVLYDLESAGYTTITLVLPAHALGAPHRRERVWIVGHAEHFGRDETEVGRGTLSGDARTTARTDEASQSPRPGSEHGQMEAMADADKSRLEGAETGGEARFWGGFERPGEAMADTDCKRQRQSEDEADTSRAGRTPRLGTSERGGRCGIDKSDEIVADTESTKCERNRPKQSRKQDGLADYGWWSVEPTVGVSDDGSPNVVVRGVNDETLPFLRHCVIAQEVQRQVGRQRTVQAQEILRQKVYGTGICQRCAITQGLVSLESEENTRKLLRVVWGYGESARTSYRREAAQQLVEQYPDTMCQLSYFAPPPCQACWADGSWEAGIMRVAHGSPHRVDRLRLLGNGQVVQAAQFIGEGIMKYTKENRDAE